MYLSIVRKKNRRGDNVYGSTHTTGLREKWNINNKLGHPRTHLSAACVSCMGTVLASFKKINLAFVLVVTDYILPITYLITLSIISHVGSRTAPDSSDAFEMFNIAKDVAQAMDKYCSARFIPGPKKKSHWQTQPALPHDHLRTFTAAKTKHITRIRFRRVSHEPFWQELTGIGVHSRIVTDMPAPSTRSV